MTTNNLTHDPYNLIITGVGGQGNVLASRMVGDMLCRQGFDITIGETFGASQRGGSVMSHVRISQKGSCSPQIPKGRGHMVVSLEPTEALRVLKQYGNPDISVITNMRPVRAIGVISGEQSYPEPEKLKAWLEQFSSQAWFLDTTDAVNCLGNPIFGNVMLVGALSESKTLPLDRKIFETVVRARMPANKIAVNLKAFDMGRELLRNETVLKKQHYSPKTLKSKYRS